MKYSKTCICLMYLLGVASAQTAQQGPVKTQWASGVDEPHDRSGQA